MQDVDVELLVARAPGLLLGRGGADTLVHLAVNEKLRINIVQ